MINVLYSVKCNFEDVVVYLGFAFIPGVAKPGLPDMGCCKHVLGINVFRGPPCTTSRWTIFCWKEMAAIFFQNGRHVKVISEKYLR